MTFLAAIALGSNLPSAFGGREQNLRHAIGELSQLGQVQAVSSFYDTSPVGNTDQPRFLNAALLLQTKLQPLDLLRVMLAIEHEMGRDRASVPAKGPRVIDLDLLLVSDVVIWSPELTLPHAELRNRRFVLEPLAEIAPGMIDPVSGLSIAELLLGLRD